MTDLVDRLRAEANSCRDVCNALETANCMREAADEIERLRAQIVASENLCLSAANEIDRLRLALLALSRPDGFVRATIKDDRQARIDYARAALGEPKP